MKSKPTVRFIVEVPIIPREIVVKNEDDSYTVFIRPDLMGEDQLKAVKHALWHIDHDFEGGNEVDVQDIEFRAHKYS